MSAIEPEKEKQPSVFPSLQVVEKDLLNPAFSVFPYLAFVDPSGKRLGILGRGIGSNSVQKGVIIGDKENPIRFQSGVNQQYKDLKKITIDSTKVGPMDLWQIDGDLLAPIIENGQEEPMVMVYADEGDLEPETIAEEDLEEGVISNVDPNIHKMALLQLMKATASAKEIQIPREPYQNLESEARFDFEPNVKQPFIYFTMGNIFAFFGRDDYGALRASRQEFAQWSRNLYNRVYRAFFDPPTHEEPVNPEEEGWLRRLFEAMEEPADLQALDPHKHRIPVPDFSGNANLAEITEFFSKLVGEDKPPEPKEEVKKEKVPLFSISFSETSEIEKKEHTFEFITKLDYEIDEVNKSYARDSMGNMYVFKQEVRSGSPSQLEIMPIKDSKAKKILKSTSNGVYYLSQRGNVIFASIDGETQPLWQSGYEVTEATSVGSDILLLTSDGNSGKIGVLDSEHTKFSNYFDHNNGKLYPVSKNTFALTRPKASTFYRYQTKQDSVDLFEIQKYQEGLIRNAQEIPGGLSLLTVQNPWAMELHIYNPSTGTASKKINLGINKVKPSIAIQDNNACMVLVSDPPVLRQGKIVTFDIGAVLEDPDRSMMYDPEQLPGVTITKINSSEILKKSYSSSSQLAYVTPDGDQNFKMILANTMFNLKLK